MILFPNAKTNLGLQVLGKRDDGFHDIETVMIPVPLYDGLEVVTATEGNDVSFTTSGIPVPDDGTPNICLRAYELMQHNAKKNGKELPPVRIHLHKHIPIGSGLGGGSADATGMLKLLSGMFSMRPSDESNIIHPLQKDMGHPNRDQDHQRNGKHEILHEIATTLGSDCPYFLHNTTMLATGRGEILKSISLPGLQNLFMVLVVPPIHISTAAAYNLLTPKTPKTPLVEAIKEPVKRWRHCINNDFESVVFPLHPTIRTLKETLYEQGAIYASMSGSGSSVYGLFEKPNAYDGEKILQIKKICANLRIHVLQRIPQHQ
jgi:4-diphosphocytidyl-2-C-methyl-D-erythritol kinase